MKHFGVAVRICAWGWRWLLAIVWIAVRPVDPMVVPASAPETAFRVERDARRLSGWRAYCNRAGTARYAAGREAPPQLRIQLE